jgi:hypothetical protein
MTQAEQVDRAISVAPTYRDPYCPLPHPVPVPMNAPA